MKSRYGSTGHRGAGRTGPARRRAASGDIVAVVRNAAKASDLAAKATGTRGGIREPVCAGGCAGGCRPSAAVSSSEVGRRASSTGTSSTPHARRACTISSTPAREGGHLAACPRPETQGHGGVHRRVDCVTSCAQLVHGKLFADGRDARRPNHRRRGRRAAGERLARRLRGRCGRRIAGTGHEGRSTSSLGDYAWNYHELADAIAGIIGKPVVYRSVDFPPDAFLKDPDGRGNRRVYRGAGAGIAGGALSEAGGELSALIGRPTVPLKEGLKAALG